MSIQFIPDDPVTPLSPVAIDTGARVARDEAEDAADAAAASASAAAAAAGYSAPTDNYTLVLGDAGKTIGLNKATAISLTVPPSASVAFPLNTRIDLGQYGAGQVTVVPGSGVTIRSVGGALKTRVQYSGASLIKIGADEWWLFGDVIA